MGTGFFIHQIVILLFIANSVCSESRILGCMRNLGLLTLTPEYSIPLKFFFLDRRNLGCAILFAFSSFLQTATVVRLFAGSADLALLMYRMGSVVC